jgi:hypothetical protein
LYKDRKHGGRRKCMTSTAQSSPGASCSTFSLDGWSESATTDSLPTESRLEVSPEHVRSSMHPSLRARQDPVRHGTTSIADSLEKIQRDALAAERDAS